MINRFKKNINLSNLARYLFLFFFTLTPAVAQQTNWNDIALAPLLQYPNQKGFIRQSLINLTYVNKADLPAPYDFLLTQQLMTLGIAKHYRRTPKVRTPLYAHYNPKQKIYARAIIMIVDNNRSRDDALAADKVGEATIVELGLINMNFAALPAQVIDSVLHTKIPFGALLASNQIKTHNINTQYFKINCNADLDIYLKCSHHPTLYGRTNTLIRNDNGQWVARVVEILTDAELSTSITHAAPANPLATFKSTCVCVGCYLNYANLVNYQPSQLTKKDGSCVKESYCDLRYARLAHANLMNSDFSNRDTCVRRANFSRAYFYYANLTRAKWRDVELRGAHLDHANLSGSDLQMVAAGFANFSSANMNSVKAPYQVMGGLGADFRHANFSYTNLSNAELAGDFGDANFSHANLEHAVLTEIVISGKKTGKVNFSYANLKGASINLQDNGYTLGELFCHTTMPDGKINDRDCPH
jgi:uncharacterized protein YjbI with pentapeptide repeats